MIVLVVPKTVLDCTVVKDPTDPQHFRMKYTRMGNSGIKQAEFCDAGMNPYLFVRRKDKSIVKSLLSSSKWSKSFRKIVDNGEFLSFQQEPMIKVEMSGPYQVGKFRDAIEAKGAITAESDIPFVRRWFIDMGIRQPLMDKILYTDIEIDNRAGTWSPDYPEGQIISIAAKGSDGKEFFFCNKDERYVLHHFFNLIEKHYQVITGWNFCGRKGDAGNPFDWPYIVARANKIGLRRQFIPIQPMDCYRSYLRFIDYESIGESNGLDDVALRHLGIGKADKYDGFKAWDSLVNDPEHKWLKTYNMRDAELVKMLDEELSICNPYIVSASELPVFLRDLDKMSIVWEQMYLQHCRELNPRLTFPRKRQVTYGDVRGALNFEPMPGAHDAVMVVDYAGLYISVMQLVSISPELVYRFQEKLVDEEGVDPDDMLTSDFLTVDVVRKYIQFAESQSVPPVYKRILMELTEKRNRQKEERKQAADKFGKDSFEYKYFDAAQKFTKVVLVSGYGVQGKKKKKVKTGYERFYNVLMANMITFVSRQIQIWTKQYFESREWTVTYGDTDSVFLMKKDIHWLELGTNAEEIAIECTRHARKWAAETFGMSDVSFLTIKAEKVYSKIAFGQEKQKKNYVGIYKWHEDSGFCEPVYQVKGAAQKRTSTCELAKEVEHEIIELLFEYGDRSWEPVQIYLERLRRELLDGELDEKLVLSSGMNKPIQEYKENSIWRRVAEKLIAQGRFRPGERIQWVVRQSKPMRIEYPIISDSDFDSLEMTYDGYRYYMDMLNKLVRKWVPPSMNQTIVEAYI